MAVTGIILMGFVLAHMIGNLKVFLGKDEINRYGEWLRDARRARLPRARWCCGSCGSVLIAAFVVHIHAADQLTRMNRKARPDAVPVAARLRRRQLRVAHDALDRRHRRPVPHLPPAGPHVGHRRTRTSCAAIRTTTSSYSFERVPGRDRLHRREPRARHPPATTAPGAMFQSLGSNNPRFNTLAPLLRRRLRRRRSSSAT